MCGGGGTILSVLDELENDVCVCGGGEGRTGNALCNGSV